MIVSICNEKGGSGKSTLAINIAINQGLNLSEIENAEENSVIKIVLT
jgi:para protein